VPGKKGYPRFQRDNRSVEYKVTGWKLNPDGRHLTFTDGCGIGRVRLVGTRALATYPFQQIKRVRRVRRLRRVRRADGSSAPFCVAPFCVAPFCVAPFCVEAERPVEHVPTDRQVGIDLGRKVCSADSAGKPVENPRFLRKGERRIKRLQRQVSRTYDPTRKQAKRPQSHN
jgi:putative transposase